MASGALVSAGFHYQAYPSRDTLEIYGTEGTLVFDPFDGESFSVHRGTNVPVEAVTYPIPSPVHLPFVQALVDVYRGESASPHVTGEEGTKTTQILDVALRSRR
jgi:predicted dehydrogenase